MLLGEADSTRRGDRPRSGDARGADHGATLARDRAKYWDDVQGTIQVRTPDRSLDIMLNGWLVYQTLACRLWARAALYQAGGAYGFRDQLQDVIALIAATASSSPASTCCVPRPISSSRATSSTGGIRRPAAASARSISDDRLWLPYAVDRYLAVTGDHGVLDETVPYLEGPPLRPEQDDAYFQPGTSSRQRNAVRALRGGDRLQPRRRRPRAAADRRRATGTTA